MKTARIRVAEPTAEELCPAVASVGGTPGTLHFRRKYLISSLFFVILGTSKVRTSFLRSTPDSSFKFPTSPCRYVATSLLTKPALYRGFFICTAKANFFLRSPLLLNLQLST